MKAVQFGAGNIGRGFVGLLLHEGGYELVFSDVAASLVASINDVSEYTVHEVGEGGTEYIRLSGVVNPYFVSTANTISSANVADARIEYKESGAISEAQVMGWLARFFLSVLPF